MEDDVLTLKFYLLMVSDYTKLIDNTSLLDILYNNIDPLFIVDCGGAQYARDKGIPVILFPKLKDGSGLSSDELIIALR